jgi:hypothetical protein
VFDSYVRCKPASLIQFALANLSRTFVTLYYMIINAKILMQVFTWPT